MTENDSAGGDYGYDLAHQEASGTTAPGRQDELEPVTHSPVVRQPSLEDDLGYDQAHDF